ncbi:hypothetical protein CAOG_08518, partial [Capsaspora owczarzaki ATCC 30864]|uniref:hypothetical protein n=1 Tax=Capsaspora owczarzaki (strain ATCC 30864) TaxID=595528 RepID=UPI000352582F
MSNPSENNDADVHRLAAPAPVRGGLMTFKMRSFVSGGTEGTASKPDATEDAAMMPPPQQLPKPTGSLLGLDALARQKRQAQAQAQAPQQQQSQAHRAYGDGDGDGTGDGSDQQQQAKRARLDDVVETTTTATTATTTTTTTGERGAPQRHYRLPQAETPSHPGGVSSIARDRMHERLDRERGSGGLAVASSSSSSSHSSSSHSSASSSSSSHSSSRHRSDGHDSSRRYDDNHSDRSARRERDHRDYHQRDSDHRDRSRDSDRSRDERDDRRRDDRDDRRRDDRYASSSSSRRGHTSSVARMQVDSTPRPRSYEPSATPSRSSWDDNEHGGSSAKSTSRWDSAPTPRSDDHSRGSSSSWTTSRAPSTQRGGLTERSSSSSSSSSGSGSATSRGNSSSYRSGRDDARQTGGGKYRDENDTNVDRAYAQEDGFQEWEDEQKRLDRAWYDNEDALDTADHDPFDVSESYVKKKEAELINRQPVKRMSALQRSINADNERWERDRMVTSGVAVRTELNLDELMEEDTEARVHLLIHNIVPPFLDGRFDFTKQREPIIPLKDATSDMAQVSRKGSKAVREFRERKERQSAQEKSWNIAGTALGNLMGAEINRDIAPTVAAAARSGMSVADGAAATNTAIAGAAILSAPRSTTTESGTASGATSMLESATMSSEATSEFARTKTIREQRQFLPVFAVREQLMQVIRDNSIVIIVGETGSGKTTQLTQYLYEAGFGKHGRIGCTQPRRVAAMSVAKRVADEMGVKIGSTVGYSIRFEDCTSDETVIKYMTDGILLRESLHDSDMEKYSAIVMDEAHERALNTDVLFGILRKVMSRRRDLKLIVTSATMDSEKFSTFFGNVPVFTIPGRTFPVDVLYSKYHCEDYVEASVKQALSVHLQQPPGDLLIFMTGQEDIEVTCGLLQERLNALGEEAPPLAILPIYSQLPSDLQAKIFQKTDNQQRKCIVATNIAETSLT